MNGRKWFFVGFCVIGLLAVSFLTSEQAFAQIGGIGSDGIRAEYDLGGMQSFAENAERGLKTLYIIIWPMLALAGAAMDNSLVYGQAFFLTPALFKFWQIIRTFANFALGFYFLWKILSAFFNNKLESGYFALIKKIFIAGVLINSSWYLVGGLIDISTIATVSLGGLPIHALEGDINFKNNIYYLKTHANLNLNDSNSEKSDRYDFSIIYSCYPTSTGTNNELPTGGKANENTKYYLPCAINDQKLLQSGQEKEPLTREKRKADFINVWKTDTKIDTTKIQDSFCVYNNKLIQNNYGKNIGECKELQKLMVAGKEEGIKQCAKINDLITRSRDYTGPLFAMYTSIINVADMGITTSSGSLKQVGLTLIIKLVTLFALLIPLIAFAVVMIIRVVYLWMIIIFSPLLVLVIALERGETVKGKVDSAVQNFFNVAELVKLILLPAIATFALSISIIFLTLLHNLPLLEESNGKTETAISPKDGCRNDVITAIGNDRTDTKEGTMYDFGTFEINIAESLRRTGADIGNVFSRLGLNGIGIALMRMVVFTALKSSEFTKGVVDSIQDTARSFAGTAPIIPIGDGKFIGIDAAKDAPRQMVDKYVATQQGIQTNILEDAKSQNFDSSVGKLNNQFTEAAATSENGTSSSISSGINSTKPIGGTDFTHYTAAAPTFAKQAQTYYNGLGKQKGESVKNSLSGIKNWDDALKNPDFINWMHEDPVNKNNGGYDNFLPHRDQKRNKDEKLAIKVEKGMKAMVNDGVATEIKNPLHNNITGYHYLDKITIFERNPNTGILKDNKTQSRKINMDNDNKKQITEDEVNAFNALMQKSFKLPDKKLFNLLLQKEVSGTKSTITIKDNKIITPNVDGAGNIIGYTLSTSATQATTQATNNS